VALVDKRVFRGRTLLSSRIPQLSTPCKPCGRKMRAYSGERNSPYSIYDLKAFLSNPTITKGVRRGSPPNSIYNFETWGQQAADFIREKVGEPSVIICNSVGGLAGLQAAQEDTKLVKAVQVILLGFEEVSVGFSFPG